MLFQEMFIVNFKSDPGRPIQETIALTREQYLSFIEAEKSITLGDKDSTTEPDENAQSDKVAFTAEGIKEEAYQKFLKKPKQLQPQEDHIVCGYCGLKAKTLKRHLSSKHGVEPAAYLEEFHLEPNMSLACLKLQREGKARMGKYWDTPQGKERRAKAVQDKPEQAAAPKGAPKPKAAPKSAKPAKEAAVEQ